jgi:hypothetical protein
MNHEQGTSNDEVRAAQTSVFIIPCSIFDI